MSNKMLIDASHPEETRVVVTHGNRIEEFDFESEHKKQLKGNIYLARVTRVEPSLQAAFVEYGGNRHGFLAFSEIHPDYYQIPLADRQALIEAEEEAARQENEKSELAPEKSARSKRSRHRYAKAGDKLAQADGDAISEEIETDSEDEDRPDDSHADFGGDVEEPVELAGLEDAMEEVPTQRLWARDYKIQEVIKRRQILLVQVTKEERGNKGAALSTYLSLAGRYSVLMPNTARGGGISRKITNASDRKRLRDVVKDLDVPKGMGVILRTAGANRTKAEVKRDYEYLIRMWENVRDLTLTSIAPALVYEEGSLIKRSIRDLYNKDISEILVAGERGYREAKDFMRMLMPSHAKTVQPYRDKLPIFARNGIETQLDRMLQPEVSLKSGGYLVINQTEALVAIDVNSGRSTREHSIEETATQTNLEAAEEIARQLRLRDLAGLVVIDFIDMQEMRNVRAVEKKLKDCLKDDRARIQVGRISHFGLMEMSRQRLRASVLESTTQPCPHCSGTGYIRSESSVALHVIRAIEEYLLRNSQNNIIVRTPVNTALYVLNHKRKMLGELESRFGLNIDIEADDSVGNQHLAIYKGAVAERRTDDETPNLLAEVADVADETVNDVDEQPIVEEQSEQSKNSRNGKRRRRERDGEKQAKQQQPENGAKPGSSSDGNGEEERKRRRRRGRRGGRRNREHEGENHLPQAELVGPFADSARQQASEQKEMPVAEPIAFAADTSEQAPVVEVVAVEADSKQDEKAKPVKRGRRKAAVKTVAEKAADDVQAVTGVEAEQQPAKPKRTRRKKADAAETVADTLPEAALDGAAGGEKEEKPVKKPRVRRTKKASAALEETASASTAEKTPEQPATRSTDSRDTGQEIAQHQETQNAEPVVTSSNEDETAEDKPKRMGWWQRKGFF